MRQGEYTPNSGLRRIILGRMVGREIRSLFLSPEDDVFPEWSISF